MNRNKLINKIKRLASERVLRFHDDYSGRFMFGAECIGFSGENAECAALAALIRRKTGLEFRYDNLGLGMIYYFPGLSITKKQTFQIVEGMPIPVDSLPEGAKPVGTLCCTRSKAPGSGSMAVFPLAKHDQFDRMNE